MLFLPIITYLSAVFYDPSRSILFYFGVYAIIYGIYLTLTANYKVPRLSYLILFFAVYSGVLPLLLEVTESKGFFREVFYNQHLVTFFIIVIVYNTRFSEKFITATLVILKATIIFAVVVSIIQVFDETFWNASYYLFQDDSNLTKNIYIHRRASIFGFIEPNALGLAFIPLLSVLIGRMLYDKNKNFLIYLVLGGLVALLSNARYVMIGFIIITIQILIYEKSTIYSGLKYAFILIISAIAIFYSLSYLGYDLTDWYESRLLAEESVTETTRYKAFFTFATFFPKAPIFGSGGMTEEIVRASQEVGSSHIHVGYLSHLVSYGVFGSFFLFGFWYLLLKRLYQTARLTNYWGSFFAFLTFLWSFATMGQSSIFSYGIIFALVFDKYFQDLFYHDKGLAKQNLTKTLPG